jgi:hypothetical protein
MMSGSFTGDENCLFLNVFTNKVTELQYERLIDSVRKSGHAFHLK